MTLFLSELDPSSSDSIFSLVITLLLESLIMLTLPLAIIFCSVVYLSRNWEHLRHGHSSVVKRLVADMRRPPGSYLMLTPPPISATKILSLPFTKTFFFFLHLFYFIISLTRIATSSVLVIIIEPEIFNDNKFLKILIKIDVFQNFWQLLLKINFLLLSILRLY